MIYNIDEKGISTEHKPPYVICDTKLKPQAVTSPRLTVTVIGCGNAIGTQIPPYFVFPGKRCHSDLLEGATPGCNGTVSQTGSGWSNSQIFMKYLENHFLKYVQDDSDQHKLIIYDGHKSHVNPQVAEWACEHKIILFVLPPPLLTCVTTIGCVMLWSIPECLQPRSPKIPFKKQGPEYSEM